MRNDQGAWTVEATPGSARVITAKQPLLLSCSGQGQQASQALAAVDLRPVSNTALAGGAVVGGGVAAASLAPLLAVPGFNVLAAFGILAAAAGGAGVAGGADAISRSFAYPDRVVIPCLTLAATACLWLAQRRPIRPGLAALGRTAIDRCPGPSAVEPHLRLGSRAAGLRPPRRGRPLDGPLPPGQIAVAAHEQALRLMQVAALDVRRWVEAERLRARAL